MIVPERIWGASAGVTKWNVGVVGAMFRARAGKVSVKW